MHSLSSDDRTLELWDFVTAALTHHLGLLMRTSDRLMTRSIKNYVTSNMSVSGARGPLPHTSSVSKNVCETKENTKKCEVKRCPTRVLLEMFQEQQLPTPRAEPPVIKYKPKLRNYFLCFLKDYKLELTQSDPHNK